MLVMECLNHYDPIKRVIETKGRIQENLFDKGIICTFGLPTSTQMYQIDMKVKSKTYHSVEECNREIMNTQWCQEKITKQKNQF